MKLNTLFEDFDLVELSNPSHNNSHVSTTHNVKFGKHITPRQHMLLMSPAEWEVFICEWGTFQKSNYHLVTQLGGANDCGIDVACFITDKGFLGEWDNFQCKHYKAPLSPATASEEIGKIIWHCFCGTITVPRRYYFFSPKDCGPSLTKLLLNHEKLKAHVEESWSKICSKKITKSQEISLEGEFKHYFDSFDFSIFKYKPVDEVVEEYRNTPYFSSRFGGGLKERPPQDVPPVEIVESESIYTSQLLKAYSEHVDEKIELQNLNEHSTYSNHFKRQRESFFSAESLRVFSREAVLPGTFTALQKEIFEGVIDTVEDDHKSGFVRVKATLSEARTTPINSNGLFDVVKVGDRHGICHQLVNDGKIKWTEDD